MSSILHPKITQELRDIERRLHAADRLPSLDQLQQYYAAFREHFGPEKLKSLDGEALLTLMHGLYRDNRNTMVYWLEFKNDEEFPFIFGSISGGSALKYGVYPNAGTGKWMARGEGSRPVPITLEQAIAIARKHRDQLLAGCTLLTALSADADDAAYRDLQSNMDRLAPDVSATAWGHKYFSLLFPDKLDNYHVERYQRFHLVRLLQQSPSTGGRYVAAGSFMRVARELDMHITHLAIILNERSPRLYRHWQLHNNGREGVSTEQAWQIMQEKSCLALGWETLGNLEDITNDRAGKEKLGERLQAIQLTDGHLRNEIFDFLNDLQVADLVAVVQGNIVTGIARVAGPYYYEAGNEVPHRRPVSWLALEKWQTLEQVNRSYLLRRPNVPAMPVAIEQRILAADQQTEIPTSKSGQTPPMSHTPLDGIPGAIQAILERKGQVILYGPPGTGKTYWAEKAATELAARRTFGRSYNHLSTIERSQVSGSADSLVRLCSFHPAYGYEDFLEGYRPAAVDGRMQFVLRNGIFKQLCDQAEGRPDQNFYLIIDEINRGDIPRIFGELLTLLEKNKRGKMAVLPLSGQAFTVPPNLFIIGTMNTADRSIALLDAALRRRFGFLELMPEVSVLADAHVRGLPLASWLRELNRRILTHVGRDARNLQIGHAYLLDKNGAPVVELGHFARIVREDIIPLLEEYCYEDYERLELILGRGLVDVYSQQIRSEIFTAGSEDDLIRALLEPTPELATAVENMETGVNDADGEALA
jgi:5-methylcytosine-specific restriction protein B